MRHSFSVRSSWLGRAPAALGVAAVLTVSLVPAAAQADTVTQANSSHTVTLVTGDQVVVQDAGGRESATVVPRPGSTGGYVNQRLGGDLYVIPVTALPYVGSSLDRSLFDVTALIRDGIRDKVPVRVTGSAPGIAGGYATSASAPAFGAALAAQAGKDAASHFAKPGPLFGTVSAVKLAAPGAPQHATPHFPMHTVRILTTGTDGAPAAASLGVVNVDDAREYGDFPFANGGEARVSVPSGNYSLVAFFASVDAKGSLAAVHMVTADFVVTGDQTVTVDASKATSQVSVTTPKQSTLDDVTVNYQRNAVATGSLGYGYDVGTAPVYVAPSGAATVGGLHFNVQTHSESPAGAKSPYTYDLKLDEAGAIAADQHFQITPDQLATLKENYYSDEPKRTEGAARIQFLPYELFGFGAFHTFQAPLQRNEYVIGSPDLTFFDAVAGSLGGSFGGFTSDTGRQYAAGSTVSYDWLRGPLAPGLSNPTSNGFWSCRACRRDDAITVLLIPAVDSAGHSMFLDPPGTGVVSTSHFQLLSGSTSLLDGNDIVGGTVTAPAAPANYKIVYDQTRTAPWFHQSTVSHTEWTFASAHSGTQTVPANWICGDDGKATDCSALSMVTASYQLKTGLDGTAAAGPDQLIVTFGHAPGGPNLPITSGSVQVSFDGGTTWTPTFLDNLGGGRFRALWTNPASVKGGDVAVRVNATDVAGNTITQSVIGALTVPGAQS